MNPFVNLQLSYPHRESNKGGFKNKQFKKYVIYITHLFLHILNYYKFLEGKEHLKCLPCNSKYLQDSN